MKIAFSTLILCLLIASGSSWPSSSMALTVGGLVRQPLNLSTEDLQGFAQAEVRLTEFTGSKHFGGVFTYKGVPLRTLLEIASVRKEVPGFAKNIDLAVVVRNREGKTTALSWGEIFYKDRSNVIVAFSATPVMPTDMKGCGRCHQASIYQPALDILKRRVILPKLVLANDLVTDRSLEDVVSIEVREVKQKQFIDRESKEVPSKFTLKLLNGTSVEVPNLKGYPHVDVAMKQVGTGRGFHGFKEFSGVPMREVLKRLTISPDTDSVILATGADGYRSLLSYGEVFLAPSGEHIIVSDGTTGSSPNQQDGFSVVAPDDLLADRMVGKLATIEIISVKPTPKIYVIGIGCGDTSLLTLQAISAMGRADVFICPADARDRFAIYLADKPILFDPMLNAEWIFRKNNPGLSETDLKAKMEQQREADMQKIHNALKAGKNVALLEYGDPTIYGGWRNWIDHEFPGQVEAVAGIGSFGAGNIAIEKDITCTEGSMVLTWPEALKTNEALLQAAGAKGDTMAIYMGLREIRDLAPRLQKYYPAGTPVHVVYDAGTTDSLRVLKTDLEGMVSAIEQEKEKQRGLIYVGPCLK